jgi:hypothetical protein
MDMEITVPFGCTATVIHPKQAREYSLSGSVKKIDKEKQIDLESGNFKLTYNL